MKVGDPLSLILRGKSSSRVWSVEPEVTVYDALRLMSENEIGALPVVSGGNLLGVISERDYARKIILVGRSSKETKVREIMTSPAVTASAQATVDEAMRLMTERRIRHLPVVDGTGRLAGIVSIGDLVKWIITSHEKTIAQLEQYIAGAAG
jgi:CBS domain-containing protein